MACGAISFVVLWLIDRLEPTCYLFDSGWRGLEGDCWPPTRSVSVRNGRRKLREEMRRCRDGKIPRRMLKNATTNARNSSFHSFHSLLDCILSSRFFFMRMYFWTQLFEYFFKLNEPLQRGSEFDRCNVAAMEKLYNYNSINTIKQLISDAHYPSERFKSILIIFRQSDTDRRSKWNVEVRLIDATLPQRKNSTTIVQ